MSSCRSHYTKEFTRAGYRQSRSGQVIKKQRQIGRTTGQKSGRGQDHAPIGPVEQRTQGGLISGTISLFGKISLLM
jgi:hypothetical protein